MITASLTTKRHDTARAVLDHAGVALVASGARGELALGLLDQLAREPDAWGRELRFLTVDDVHGVPLAFAMQTGAYPALVVGFGDYDDAVGRALARAILDEWHPDELNGARSWSEPVAAHLAALLGTQHTLVTPMRAMEARQLVASAPVIGVARVATSDDADIMVEWALAFDAEALAQEAAMTRAEAVARMTRILPTGDVLFWEVDGQPVSTASISRRTSRSACISLVYTPPAQRGKGYARSLVHHLSQRELDAGCEWVSLFTDANNPTSNFIYAQIGYRHVCDFALFALR